MPTLDPSPRAAKRQKTASDSPSLPLTSRVLRTVKQVVYGNALDPKINHDFDPAAKLIESGNDILGKAAKNTPRRKSDGKDARRVQSTGGKKGASTPITHHISQQPDARDESDEQDGEMEGTPSRRRKPGVRGKVYEGSTEMIQEAAAEPVETSTTKKKGKKHKGWKGWVEIEEADELQGDGGPVDGAGNSDNTLLEADPVDSGGDLSPAVRRAKKRVKQLLEIDMRDQPGTETPSGRLRRKSGRRRLSAGDDGIAANATSVTTTTSLRRSPSRREQPLGTGSVLGDQQDEDEEGNLGFGRIPMRDASVDDLAQGHRIDERDDAQTVDPPSSKSRNKDKNLATSSSHGDSSPARVSPVLVLQSPSKVAEARRQSDHTQKLQNLLENEPEVLAMLQTRILENLTGKRRLPLINLEIDYRRVHQLIEQTVLAGEGNSMLIIGSRGSGKTTLVETAISELATDHRDEFHVVRLNGFIHTDDKLALREIWRQLGREMEVEADVMGGRSNYADTLTSLLALLSHPAQEMEQDDTANAATAKSVVFILDEFDLFASHPRQTLLYNLFDVAQSRNAPIAVLGLTSKVNVVDSLEKRVKSRFGQRYVHLSLPRGFDAFREICISALYYRPSIQHRFQSNSAALQSISDAWNAYLVYVFVDSEVERFLRKIYTTNKSVSAFLSASLLPIATMTASNIPTPASFISHPLEPPDSNLALLSSLSTLELSLLIAAARLDIILDTDVCTFGMVYDEYVALAGRSKLQSSAAGQMAVGGGARVWSKDVSRGAWEHLADLELVLPAVGAGRGGGGRGQMWRVDVGLEEIGTGLESVDVPGKAGLLKWCKAI